MQDAQHCVTCALREALSVFTICVHETQPCLFDEKSSDLKDTWDANHAVPPCWLYCLNQTCLAVLCLDHHHCKGYVQSQPSDGVK